MISSGGSHRVERRSAGALRFFESVLNLEVDDGAPVAWPIAFLASHFIADHPRTPSPEPLATLVVHPLGEVPAPFDLTRGQWHRVFVRESSNALFTIVAWRSRRDHLELIRCERTDTCIAFDRRAKTIEITLSAAGAMDLVELVRDVVLKDQENRGALVLHATAAYRPGSCIVATGAQGAGKTTIVLELIEKFGYRMISGDKVLVTANAAGDVTIRGWPDYPHLGYATISRYAGLPEIAGVDEGHVPPADHAFSPYRKYAVDPVAFRKRFDAMPAGHAHRPTLIIHPMIGPGSATVLCDVNDDRAARIDAIRANVESAFARDGDDWHTYAPRDETRTAGHTTIVETLAALPAYRLVGPGYLERDPGVALTNPGGVRLSG